MSVVFVANLFWTEIGGAFHCHRGSARTVCLNYKAQHYWKACTASSGCTFVRWRSALPELADRPLARAGRSGTGAKKSSPGGC